MAKRNYIDDIEEALEYEIYRQDLKRQKLETFSYAAQTILFLTITVTSVLFISRNPSFLSSIVVNSSYDDTYLQAKVEALSTDIDKLNKELKGISDSIEILPQDPSVVGVNNRVISLQSQVDSLNATILESPDSALTARFLREKQLLIDHRLESIEESQSRLEETTNNFISDIMTIPVVGVIASIVIFAITSFLNLGWNKFKEKLGVKDKTEDKSRRIKNPSP